MLLDSLNKKKTTRDLGKNIFSIMLIIFIGFILVIRYNSINVNTEQVALFGIYYCFATIVFIISKLLFKNVINPLSIYTVFLFLLSFSFIVLSIEQSPYSIKTFLIINFSVFFYILFSIIDFPTTPVKLPQFDNELKRIFIYAIILVAFLTFISECSMFGYIPILNISTLDIYNDTNSKLIPFLHYFITLLGFMPAWLYIYLKQELITKKEFKYLLLLTIFILLNYLSKQVYLMMMMSFFMTYSYYNKVNFKLIFKWIIVFVLVLGGAIFLRFNSNTEIPFAEYFRAVAGIENEDVSATEALVVEYSSKRFTVLNEVVETKDKTEFYGFGTYTLRPILSLLFIEKIGLVHRPPELDSEKKVATFMADPYIDFGLIGVVILNSFYGYIARRYYKQYRQNKIEAVIKFAIIIFCIVMGMFVNFYNTMFIWMGLLFNKFLLGGIKTYKE